MVCIVVQYKSFWIHRAPFAKVEPPYIINIYNNYTSILSITSSYAGTSYEVCIELAEELIQWLTVTYPNPYRNISYVIR